jgi:hypothetical protein
MWVVRRGKMIAHFAGFVSFGLKLGCIDKSSRLGFLEKVLLD